jgi:hypothetical protein
VGSYSNSSDKYCHKCREPTGGKLYCRDYKCNGTGIPYADLEPEEKPNRAATIRVCDTCNRELKAMYLHCITASCTGRAITIEDPELAGPKVPKLVKGCLTCGK